MRLRSVLAGGTTSCRTTSGRCRRRSRPTALVSRSHPCPRLPLPGVSATSALAGAQVALQVLDAPQLGRVLFLGGGLSGRTEHPAVDAAGPRGGIRGCAVPARALREHPGRGRRPRRVHWYYRGACAVADGRPADGQSINDRRDGRAVADRLALRGARVASRLLGRGKRCCRTCSPPRRAQGSEPRLRTLFPDAAARELVGADGVHERPVALLSLGDRHPAIEPSGPAERGTLPAVEFPLITEAQRAGERDELGGRGNAPARSALPVSPPHEAILRRGSQRLIDPRRSRDGSWSGRCAPRCAGSTCRTGSSCTASRTSRPASTWWPDLDAPGRSGSLRDESLPIFSTSSSLADAAYVVVGRSSAPRSTTGYRNAQLAAGSWRGGCT